MFLGVAITLGLTLVGSRYAYSELLTKNPVLFIVHKLKSRVVRTVLDVRNAEDAERLVRLVARDDASGDELASRLYKIYEHFPPDEKDMMTLCVLYQATSRNGTFKEYACTVLYGVATDVLCNQLSCKKIGWLQRVHSLDNVASKTAGVRRTLSF